MKLMKSLFAAALFASVMGGALSNATAEDGVIIKDELTIDGYCHEKFTPMTTRSLDSDNPVLTDSGSIIDYYGPCNESTVGQDQIQEQKLEAEHRFTNDYED